MELTSLALENLKALIEKAGGRQAFVDIIGYSESYLSTIIKNKNMPRPFFDSIKEKFDYSEDQFFKTLIRDNSDILNAFQGKYYAYFLASTYKHYIDVADILIYKDNITFIIRSSNKSKELIGKIYVHNNSINFNLELSNGDEIYHTFIMMLNPHVISTSEYIGGLGFLLEQSDNLPCVKKIIISKKEFLIDNLNDEAFIYLFEKLQLKNDIDVLSLSPEHMTVKQREEIENIKFFNLPLQDEKSVFKYIKSKIRDDLVQNQ